ncbi:MAG: sugar-binding domain-containing protein, partial [Candidatus Izemoplasmatales bacterium]
MKRITKSLNYNWYFQPDFKEDCLKENYNYLEHDIVNIPHSLKILPYNYFNEKDYQFTGTYFKEIDIEEEDFNSDIILKFFGVMNVATVYINNQEIIKNEGGYTPFEVLTNDYLKIGKNILIVKVDGLEVKDIPPFGNLVDYLGYSGIYREVVLEFKPKVRITKAHIFTDDIHVLNQNKMLLNLDISTNYKDDEFLLKLELYDNDSIVLSHEFKDSFNSDALFSLEVDNIERWTLEKPKLYKAKISIVNKKAEIIDSVTERFG